MRKQSNHLAGVVFSNRGEIPAPFVTSQFTHYLNSETRNWGKGRTFLIPRKFIDSLETHIIGKVIFP